MHRQHLSFLLLLGCAGDPPLPQQGEGWSLSAVETGGEAGLSDLALGPDGQLWAISERPGRLLQLDGGGARVSRVLSIQGLPPDSEPESVAVMADGTIWVGTESGQDGRASDVILRVEIQGEQARVVEQVELPWTAWGLSPEGNAGIEGLCAAGETLVAAGEPVSQAGGQRKAPIGIRTATGWVPYWLPLRSSEGKLSAASCERLPDGGLSMAVIERHFSVLHLLQVQIPADSVPGSILAGVEEIPIADAVRRFGANFEGLAQIDGAWLLLSDNQSRTISGPTVLARIQR